MKKLLVSVLSVVMATLSLTACGGGEQTDAKKTYTYQDAVGTMSSSWNRLTYQTVDQDYPLQYMTSGFYNFVFNDDFSGYEIVPEMAAEKPIDITAGMKDKEKWGIPKDAEKGYAYRIKLNPDTKFHDGTPITAETYVESMKLLLKPEYINYRASDYIDGDLAIAGAHEYFNSLKDTVYKVIDKKYETVADAVAAGVKVYINVWKSWGMEGGKSLDGTKDCPEYLPIDDTTVYTDPNVEEGKPGYEITGKEIYDYYETQGLGTMPRHDFLREVVANESFGYKWEDGVGIYADNGDLVLVLDKALAGFQLLYNLSGTWLVNPEPYKKSISKIEGTEAYQSNYSTSVDTTYSYGPYKLVEYQTDKFMRFERNDNWWGYTDGKHTYKDPKDGKEYSMYMTDAIETRVVKEATTRKMMFMKGQLMGYGLQSEDFDSLRGSEYAYATPSETIFFFIFNGYEQAIKDREANEGFDKTKYDLETMSLTSFRKAVAVSYDRDKFASTIMPSRSGGYGLIGESYLYDPEKGLRYRDTPQAKKALCQFYSIDVEKDYGGDLDKAVESITGYDAAKAKELFTQAYNEAIEKEYITDANGDGKSDQKIRIEYAMGGPSNDFIKKTLKYLNQELAKVLVGTPFEGQIEFYESANYEDKWSEKLRSGMSDTVLAGWAGSALNPFGLTDLYVNPARAYDAKWFVADQHFMTLEVAPAPGEAKVELTLNLKEWSDALNGTKIEKDGKIYNFGDGIADVETRLDILAALEVQFLQTYDYIPMIQDGSIALLSKQVYYVIEEYNPIMGRGGIAYMKYNYDDAAWAKYVQDQGGELKY